MNVVLELANRARFSKDLAALIAEHGDQNWTIASLDIQRFRLFNIWYGKAAGDKVLRDIANYLYDLRENNGWPAGYLGDDDFMVCLPNSEETINEVYDHIQASINQSNETMRFALVMGLCSVNKWPGADPFTIYTYARIASANDRHKSGRLISHFGDQDLESLEQVHTLVNDTMRALTNGEFAVYLQPKHNSMTHRIVGFEALSRWDHPTLGFISPETFLPILNQNGLVPRLDRFVWTEACETLKRWQDEGRNLVPISVNVALDDIQEFDIVQFFSNLVEEYGIEPKLLEIEITETIFAEARSYVSPLVAELRERGFSVLIDDFGSGYSSLGMLKDTAVDVLKLDMSLIDFSQENYHRGMEVLSSVTEMSHRLDLPLVVEGVQTQGQVFILQSLNCLYVQGFYFREAMPIEEAEQLMLGADVPVYWDIKLDYAQRTFSELGELTVDNSSALMLRAFRIFSDNLLMNAPLNLESEVIYNAHVDPVFVLVPQGSQYNFSQFLDYLYKAGSVHPDDVERVAYYLDVKHLRDQFYSGKKSISARFRIRYNDVYNWVTVDAIAGGDCSPLDPWCTIIVREDELAEQLVEQLDRAYAHDILTGLFNRNKFEKDLDELAGSDIKNTACLYVDAIGLHEVNNITGHAAGDAMLQAIAEALLEEFDERYVYRIGGDEFVALAPNCTDTRAQAKLDAIRATLRQQNYEISAGIARANTGGDLRNALNVAEILMRNNKEEFYAQGGRATQARELNTKLESMLVKKADAERLLELFLPPSTTVFIVDLDSGESRFVIAADYIKESLAAAGGSFKKMLELYRDTYVAPESAPVITECLDFAELKKWVHANGHREFTFIRQGGKVFNLWISPYSDLQKEEALTMWVFTGADAEGSRLQS